MDAGWFLKQRTEFIRHFYDEGVRPFRMTMLSIENEVPPFVPPEFDPDSYSDEPPYLSEWLDAATAVELVGRSCVMILSEALKSYFDELAARVIGFSIKGPDQETRAFWRQGFVPAYREALGQVLGTDWSDCPADWDIIEQVALARNASAHGPGLTSLSLHHDRKTLEKHPMPFFASPQEINSWNGQVSEHQFLNPALTVDRESLFAAIEHIERLSDWIDNNGQRISHWRGRPTGG